ncbi:hypothetical protein AAG570_004724 [Ranatra chinensis]|uniref:FH2 domain-containing protein n=1 Tax=Ranatra chinensis TaxID=642074 RepID=A0ABD0Y206_9HEMI
MKTINWSKISGQGIKGTMWGRVKCPEVGDACYSQLEELFCQPARPKSEPMPSLGRQQAKVHLLDSKRSLAVNILLKQFKGGPQHVLEALAAGKGLPAETLRALNRLLPDKKELTMISCHPCERDQLGLAEKFYLDISHIPEYAFRIQAMLQKEEVPAIVSELEPQLLDIIKSADNLMENYSLSEFLGLVLQLGNYLNSGSYAGDAAGFKLNTLPKLLETRANKPRLTFLHYVVDVATRHNKKVLEFTTSAQELRRTARVPLSAVEEDIASLSAGVKRLAKEMENVSEEIRHQFADFMRDALDKVANLDKLLSKVKETGKKLAVHFCEDPETFQLEECFNIFADFFDKTQKASLENEQRKRQEEHMARMEVERAKAKIVKRQKKTELPEEEECLVDMLMKEIRGGTFKLRRGLPIGQS